MSTWEEQEKSLIGALGAIYDAVCEGGKDADGEGRP
jgi:hypothetical protein